LCPQKIAISDWMPKVSALLGERRWLDERPFKAG